MDKYKRLSLVSFITGALEGFFALFAAFYLFPKLTQVYEDFGATIPLTTTLAPYILFIPAIVCFILGVLVLISKTNREKYYNWTKIALIFAVVFVLLILPLVMSVGFLLPMFNLVNVIE